MMRKFVDRKHGFTLIELLVVIAIIAIVAAILFPVFARARDNARRATCMSNLKQMGLGIMQYKQDYDELFPRTRINSSPTSPDGIFYWGAGSGIYYWEQAIFPYVKSHDIYYCPSSPYRKGATSPDIGSAEPTATTLNANYSYNTLIGGNEIGGPSIKDSAIPDAAGTFMVLEYGFYSFAQQDLTGSAGGTTGAYYLPGIGQTGTSCATVLPEFKQDCEVGRHFSGITIGYADGHVKWLQSGRVKVEGNNPNGAWKPTVSH